MNDNLSPHEPLLRPDMDHRGGAGAYVVLGAMVGFVALVALAWRWLA